MLLYDSNLLDTKKEIVRIFSRWQFKSLYSHIKGFYSWFTFTLYGTEPHVCKYTNNHFILFYQFTQLFTLINGNYIFLFTDQTFLDLKKNTLIKGDSINDRPLFC